MCFRKDLRDRSFRGIVNFRNVRSESVELRQRACSTYQRGSLNPKFSAGVEVKCFPPSHPSDQYFLLTRRLGTDRRRHWLPRVASSSRRYAMR
jgi:hypothetical protein